MSKEERFKKDLVNSFLDHLSTLHETSKYGNSCRYLIMMVRRLYEKSIFPRTIRESADGTIDVEFVEDKFEASLEMYPSGAVSSYIGEWNGHNITLCEFERKLVEKYEMS